MRISLLILCDIETDIVGNNDKEKWESSVSFYAEWRKLVKIPFGVIIIYNRSGITQAKENQRLIRIKIISKRKGVIDVNTYGRRRLEVEKTKLADDREQKGRKDCTRRGWVTLLDSDEILCCVDCFSPLESSRRRPDWRSWRFADGISQREGETMEKR